MNQEQPLLGPESLNGEGSEKSGERSLADEQSLIDQQDTDENHGIKFEDWGFKVDRLFEVAYRFYRRNESKAFHPSFDIRNQMNALILQARYGNFDDGKAPDIGTLDLVGKSRRHQWSLLKGMSKTEAMSKFICTLDNICPLFKAYAEAIKISSGVQMDTQTNENGRCRSNSERRKQLESDEQLDAIHTSLCRQTYNQFKNYAEKQYPDDLPKQKYLITSLQEQYYQQYISKMNPKMTQSHPERNSTPSPTISESKSSTTDSNQVDSYMPAIEPNEASTTTITSTNTITITTYEPLEPATIWTKKGVNEFKDSLMDDKHGGTYHVIQGSLLTIQVPTYPDGRYIYWEFATEDYDIGFGLDFIYDTNLVEPLALQFHEEADDDEEDEDDLDVLAMSNEANNDIESANGVEIPNPIPDQKEALTKSRAAKYARLASTISIVPTYRRDSHEEVFVGRHRYPGQGYYLLKFDNTYSVLRSKTLFFRICYFI